MEYLDISGCNIGDAGFVEMSKCIAHIQGLRIGANSDDQLTIAGISAISEAVRILPKPVSE